MSSKWFSILCRFVGVFSLVLCIAHASAPVAENAAVIQDDDQATKSSSSFRFLHKTVIIPHDQKKHRGGEDAAATSDQLLVVADGVGGWANRGVNPGLYSKLLTQTIVEMYEKELGSSKSSQNGVSSDRLMEIVDKANHLAASEHLGSATCTVVQLVGPHTIQTLNIGDSGYSIHRRTAAPGEGEKSNDNLPPLEVAFASTPGQKQFNFPHQIGGQYGDVVKDVAELNTHTLQEGDVVVVYSDGVSDNLYPHEYHDCIDRYSYISSSKTSSNEVDLVSHSMVADCIARQAYQLGKDKTFDSPFAQGARAVGKRYMGGKHDDITVTVARVVLDDVGVASSSASGPSSAPTSTDTLEKEDVHYSESIFLYTGPVPSKDDLPTLEQALATMESATAGGGATNDEL
jgi:protein phosphatase PTC7